jgi:predicted NAD-dependent protein-ADP-ribosyltransferase YbiA (DUF1768 family)
MDKCSYFLENRALFGSCPSQSIIDELEGIGVRYFINLTFPNERHVNEYKTNFTMIRYSIKDRSVPDNPLTFCSFIIDIVTIFMSLKGSEKIYVHCKGGHGRSGIVVAVFLCVYLKISVEEALHLTKTAHANRKTMRDKWRVIGSPQTESQKKFVRDMCEPIMYHPHQYTCFNTLSANSVFVNDLGLFPTAEAAYQAFKNPLNESYILALQQPETDPLDIGKKVELRKDKKWNDIKILVMYTILKMKFDQYPEHRNTLLQTYLRPIVRVSKKQTFWCHMQNNIFGRLLQKLRTEYQKQFKNLNIR